jgi:hypothetical protein
VAIVPAKIQETRIKPKLSIALLDPLKVALEVGIAAEGLAPPRISRVSIISIIIEMLR